MKSYQLIDQIPFKALPSTLCVLLFFVVVMSDCKKHDEEINPNLKCFLTKTGYNETFTYTSDNKLSRMDIVTDFWIFSYDANGIISQVIYGNGRAGSSELHFTYNAKHQVTELSGHTYEYNQTGQLVKMIEETDWYTDYEYADATTKNILRSTTHTPYGLQTNEFEYDAKRTPHANLGIDYFFPGRYTDNNVVKYSYKQHWYDNSVWGDDTQSTATTVYQYNTSGYPTQSSDGNTFTYDCR